MKINIREYRSGNQKWTIQRNWQHDPKDYRNITPRHIQTKEECSHCCSECHIHIRVFNNEQNYIVLLPDQFY